MFSKLHIAISSALFLVLVYCWWGFIQSGWMCALAIACAYHYCLTLVGLRDTPGWSSPVIALLCAGVIAIVALTQNPITSIYVGGAILLAVCVFLNRPGQTGLSPLLLTGVLIGIALLASPLTVSRVILALPDLPVPSKFELHSNPDSRIRHYASKSFPTHWIAPIEVDLSANNIRFGDATPMIHLQARRDTHFVITEIEYKFLNVSLQRITGDALHAITLHPRSDAVRIDRPPGAMVVTDIGSNESAWFELPELDTGTIGLTETWQVTAYKLAIWILACLAVQLWRPRRLQ